MRTMTPDPAVDWADAEQLPLDPRVVPATEFVLGFARSGHNAGYPTADLEERVVSLAGYFGLAGAQASATPTLVEVSFGSLPRQHSFTLRVRRAGNRSSEADAASST